MVAWNLSRISNGVKTMNEHAAKTDYGRWN